MEDHSSPPPPPPPLPKTYRLTASSISYTKPTATTVAILRSLPFIFRPCTATATATAQSQPYILRDVSFTAYPGQILAIVGPSGSGKSTLLTILSAHTAPTSGHLFLNSAVASAATLRRISYYLPQHDCFLPLLTVSETFAFSAALLHSTTAAAAAATAAILSDLHLTHLSTTLISGNLSGGERRRVSIGLSLLHDPSILLLDEPTSGLDSTAAFHVIKTLKSTAVSRRCTVVLSIHQPSFKLLTTIDKFLLLSNGIVLHHGTLLSLQSHLDSLNFTVPSHFNPLEFAIETLTLTLTRTLTHTKTASKSTSKHQINTKLNPKITYKSTRSHEIITLSKRFFKIIYRTKQLLLTTTLEVLIVGLVLGTIYIKIGTNKEGIHKRLGLFAFTLTFLLSSTTETLPIFINERPILIREASNGVYRLSSYLVANTVVFMPYLGMVAVVYATAVYFMVGLCGQWAAFGYFVVVVWAVVLVANSLMMVLSTVAPNYIAGSSLVAMVLAGFFLFSGYFIRKDSLPRYWVFMHYMSMYKYALDGMLINEYSCIGDKCMIWYQDNKHSCMLTGHDVMLKRGPRKSQLWVNVYFLFGFFLLYRVLSLFLMIRRVSTSKR